MMVLLDLGIWVPVTGLQILSIDHSDSATLPFSRGSIFQQQLRNVAMSFHGGCLEWCPISFSPDVYVRSMVKQQPHKPETSPPPTLGTGGYHCHEFVLPKGLRAGGAARP
jgi:hypothetical protein